MNADKELDYPFTFASAHDDARDEPFYEMNRELLCINENYGD